MNRERGGRRREANWSTLRQPERWALTIATPVGRQQVELTLLEDGGRLEGEAHGKDETLPLIDAVRDGDRLTWSLRMTRPIRLQLHFDVAIDGDHLTGTAKAGLFPRSAVTGVRLAP
jgi:hypothetical protein